MLDILVRRSIDPDWNSKVIGLDIVELANDESKKVGRHQRRFVELHSLLGATTHLRVDLRLGSNIHITQASKMLVCNQGDGELGFQRRLVEAGKRSSRICSLQLTRGKDCLTAIGILVGRSVKSSHLVIERSGELELKLCLRSFWQGLVECNLRGLC